MFDNDKNLSLIANKIRIWITPLCEHDSHADIVKSRQFLYRRNEPQSTNYIIFIHDLLYIPSADLVYYCLGLIRSRIEL